MSWFCVWCLSWQRGRGACNKCGKPGGLDREFDTILPDGERIVPREKQKNNDSPGRVVGMEVA